MYAWLVRNIAGISVAGSVETRISRSVARNIIGDRARWRFDTWMRDTAPTASTGYSIWPLPVSKDIKGLGWKSPKLLGDIQVENGVLVGNADWSATDGGSSICPSG